MNTKIAVLKGDGIGPEVIEQAVGALEAISEKYGHSFTFKELLVGGASIDAIGVPMGDDVIDECLKCDAVLLGAVGGPKWDGLERALRPERALFALRKELKLYANLRPAVMNAAFRDSCPLKPEVAGSFDIMIVRELTGGLYFGEKGRNKSPEGVEAYDVMRYSENEIERIGRRAFELARKRRKMLTSVDKENVLETSRLWREVMHRLRSDYPDVEYSEMYVDNASMQLIRNPAGFDVIVTENTFGDILSDEAGMLTGSIGLLPSASMGDGSFGMYEPVHGSAPDIAGRNIANPAAAILSASMLLKYSLGMDTESGDIDSAVYGALADGIRTNDMSGGVKRVSTTEFGKIICDRIKNKTDFNNRG